MLFTVSSRMSNKKVAEAVTNAFLFSGPSIGVRQTFIDLAFQGVGRAAAGMEPYKVPESTKWNHGAVQNSGWEDGGLLGDYDASSKSQSK